MWSEGLDRAGLRIVRLDKDGDKEELTLDHPVVTEIGKDTLVVSAEDSKGIHSRSLSMRPASR